MSCPEDSFYLRHTEVVAKELIGKKLVRILKKDGKNCRLAGIIVETEAYGYSNDSASHAHSGMTRRNAAMFGKVGRAYVYFTYGNHFCVNVSARSNEVDAGAVLIRGLMPIEGVEIMRQFRSVYNSDSGRNIFSLTSGPGKLAQALSINLMLNGASMTDFRSKLHIEFGIEPRFIVSTPRIGITKATDKNWRFLDPFNPFISHKVT